MQNSPVPEHRFPLTVQAFHQRFPDEATCLDFLFHERWPNGFICPTCRYQPETQEPAKNITCPHCGHPTSLTTNTIMHGTKKPLQQWLFCIWWLASSDKGASARELQRLLNLSSYQTAWSWLQKLRMAMGMADRTPCRGTVELWAKPLAPVLSDHNEVCILTAAETILPSGIIGRIKMEHASHLTQENVNRFLSCCVAPGSCLIVPADRIYRGIDRDKYITVIACPGRDGLRIDQIPESFAIWLNRIHRGGVILKHLQLYLDEFCFRSNAAMLATTEAVFHFLLSGVFNKKSPSYKTLTSNNQEG